jgi:hypothetical protein
MVTVVEGIGEEGMTEERSRPSAAGMSEEEVKWERSQRQGDLGVYPVR